MWEESETIPSIIEREVPSLEETLANQKESLRKSAFWEIGLGTLVVLIHLAVFAYLIIYPGDLVDDSGEPLSWRLLFRSIIFIFGFVAIGGGMLGLYRANHLTIDDILPSPHAVEFLEEAALITPYFTYIMIGGIVTIAIFQFGTGLDQSISVAAFVKPDFLNKHEYWRVLTGSVMHGGFLHIYFNAQALLGFGSLIEKLSNRAHLYIVFLLAAIGGGLLSLLFMPAGISVGASGGIMGFVGYLAVFGYRRKSQLPADFLKSMLINVGFIAAIGIIGYQLIDNFAHLGGFLVGAAYGFVQIPSDPNADPRDTGTGIKALGFVALGIFVCASIFTMYILLTSH